MRKDQARDLMQSEVANGKESSFSRIGRISESTPEGQVVVEIAGKGKRVARLLAGMDGKELSRGENRGREVLLLFPEGDEDRPIIVGLMQDPLFDLVSIEVENVEENAEVPKEFRIDGRKVLIDAEEEVSIRCGKGSIILRKDGKIIIKGTDVLSRSAGTNRIKGASVNIN